MTTPPRADSYLERFTRNDAEMRKQLGREPVLIDHAARAIQQQTAAGLAKTMHEAIIEVVREFQANLAADEEVGAMLASFGHQITITVTSVGYHPPHLVIFKGVTADDKEVDLLQH